MGKEPIVLTDQIKPTPALVRAGMEALRHMGARRIAIASPYPKRHNDALTSHMTANGFAIVRAEGMDLPFKEMQNLPPADIRKFAGHVLAAAAERMGDARAGRAGDHVAGAHRDLLVAEGQRAFAVEVSSQCVKSHPETFGG